MLFVRTLLAACALAALALPAGAQTQRFDFTPAPASPDWQSVPAGSAYDAVRGYGFEPASGASTVFSVAVPEGDYTVTLWPAGSAPITVWAESRRLMAERVEGRVQFTVNVRQPELGPPTANGGAPTLLRLKAREQGSRAWDNRLTLVFDQPVARVEVQSATPIRLVLMGDSTIADQAGDDFASWGQMIPRFLDPAVSVANHAESGESLKTYLRALRLDKALTQLRPGDVAMIQFGHNDQKPQNPLAYAEAETAYRSYLRLYIEEVRRRGARPMLVTSTHRRMFESDGTIRNSHGDYPEAVRIVSREEGIPVIDLTEITRRLYEAMGPEQSRLAFATNGRDATHHNVYGAYLLAWAVADRLRELDDPIAAHFSTANPRLDLARPPSREDVNLQLPPSAPSEAPAGS